MQYAIVRFGQETVVARYVGHADAMAISRAVFRDSLAEIAVRPLLTEPAQSKPGWLNSSLVPSPSPATPSLPAGWHVEPGAPSGCSGLPSPTQAVSASPVGDFTVAFRAAAWPGPSIDAARAARGCAALGMAGTDRYSYSTRAPWWGTPYAARGLLVPTAGGGLMQLELVAPEASVPAVLPLFDAWVRSISRQ
jgi:hypothetical protein